MLFLVAGSALSVASSAARRTAVVARLAGRPNTELVWRAAQVRSALLQSFVYQNEIRKNVARKTVVCHRAVAGETRWVAVDALSVEGLVLIQPAVVLQAGSGNAEQRVRRRRSVSFAARGALVAAACFPLIQLVGSSFAIRA